MRRLVILIMLVVGLVAVYPATVHASSPPSGQIAFVRGGDIWIVNADGTNRRRLTTSDEQESGPSWSPDGSTIAYTRGSELWIMGADGANQRYVPLTLNEQTMPGTDEPGTARGVDIVAWSPGGADITVAAMALTWDVPGGIFNHQLYLVHPDGSSQRRMGPLYGGAYGGMRGLSWRPDGSQLVCSPRFRQGGGRAVIYDVTTQAFSVPFPSQSGGRAMWNAAWSPDGKDIAACVFDASSTYPGQPSHVAIIDMQTHKERALRITQQSESSWIQSSWSPDGTWLACSSYDGQADQPDAYLLSADGSQSRLLIADAADVSWCPVVSDPTPGPLIVLIGGLGSNIPSSTTNPAGGDWALVKQRLEREGYQVYVAGTRQNAPANQAPYAIDSNSADWGESAERLDRQLVAAGFKDRQLVLVGHSMGGLIARVYAKIWGGLESGCEPLGLVQLGTPNKGSEAATLKGLVPLTSDAVHQLGDAGVMALFNAQFPNAEGLPIYRIAGKYFPKAAKSYLAKHKKLKLALAFAAIVGVYGTANNDSVVTVDSVYGGPTAGWRGCDVFQAVHNDSGALSSFRSDAGCVLPYRSGKEGGAAIDEEIVQQIIKDVRGVENESNARLRGGAAVVEGTRLQGRDGLGRGLQARSLMRTLVVDR